MTKISLIVAADQNNAIGKDNQMLTHLPNDLKYFKEKTSIYPIIMGRKTFESLPNGALPNRRNIVVSRNKDLQLENCEICNSIEEALNLCKNEPKVFIIGGGTIYKQTIDIADTIYLTRIQYTFPNAEIYFPKLDPKQWEEVWREEHYADNRHKYDYSFIQYSKINA